MEGKTYDPRIVQLAYKMPRRALVEDLKKLAIHGLGRGINGMGGWSKDELVNEWLRQYGEQNA